MPPAPSPHRRRSCSGRGTDRSPHRDRFPAVCRRRGPRNHRCRNVRSMRALQVAPQERSAHSSRPLAVRHCSMRPHLSLRCCSRVSAFAASAGDDAAALAASITIAVFRQSKALDADEGPRSLYRLRSCTNARPPPKKPPNVSAAETAITNSQLKRQLTGT